MPISLDKRTQDATDTLVSLMKDQAAKGIDLGDVSAQVDLGVDFSASMSARYPKEVDDLVARVLALSLTGLDDDGRIPVFFYDASVFDPVIADPSNYQGIVTDFASRHRMGGTRYGPVIKAMLDSAPKKGLLHRQPDVEAEKLQAPHLHIFVTDGVPADKEEVSRLLVEASGRPHFFAFIGLGVSLDFLRLLDTMSGRVLDNVSLTEVQSTLAMDDPTFFRTVLDEWLTQWLPAARQAGVTQK